MTVEATTHEVARAQRALEAIKKLVAAHFGISVADLLATGRAEPLVTHRQVAMCLCRELTAASFPDIARAFEKKDHNTVMHACEAVPKKAQTDAALRFNLESLRKKAAAAIK